ncbi:hypothetical protein [Anthocerotibacter panamensis]|uniref:hypothetical protein n=1 Tax=Anthocerotibacter panamensis TaxID=2857077 RepID=UPI001C404930|nr:hypothetical protein [Anthocerotibacter panamensis]
MSAPLEAGLATFRSRHPAGGVVTELLRVEQGLYVVRAEVAVDKTSLGSGLASADTVEGAEDAAILRALKIAGFTSGQVALPEMRPAPIPTATPPSYERNGSAKTSPLPVSAPDPVLDKYDPEDEESFMDLSELIAETDVQLKRIGWDSQQGKAYLTRTYGKTARKQLSEDELRDFLRYLKTQPTFMNRRAQESPF